MAVQQSGAIWFLFTRPPARTRLNLFLTMPKWNMFLWAWGTTWKNKNIQSKIPSLKDIYTFNEISAANHWTKLLFALSNDGISKIEPQKKNKRRSSCHHHLYIRHHGRPQRVMLSHRNIVSVFFFQRKFSIYRQPFLQGIKFFAAQSHLRKIVSYVYMFSGYSIYFAESLDTIVVNLQELRPDIFTTVPRLLEKCMSASWPKAQS